MSVQHSSWAIIWETKHKMSWYDLLRYPRDPLKAGVGRSSINTIHALKFEQIIYLSKKNWLIKLQFKQYALSTIINTEFMYNTGIVSTEFQSEPSQLHASLHKEGLTLNLIRGEKVGTIFQLWEFSTLSNLMTLVFGLDLKN